MVSLLPCKPKKLCSPVSSDYQMTVPSMMFSHLYVIQMIERGIADADAGRLIPHETVAEEMRLKWQVGREA